MVEDAIREFQKTYQLKRFSSNSEENGIITDSYSESVDFLAVIQPMSGKDLKNVPEGQNSIDWLSCWSEVNFDLKDLVTYNSLDYEVQKKERWDETIYYKYSIVKTQDNF